MKKISIIFITGVLLAMFSCKSNEKVNNKKDEKVNNKKESSQFSNVTPMQKLSAEKSIKLPNENNPVVAYKFSADPAVLTYKDTVYVYATNDMQQFEFSKGKTENSYDKISSLNVFYSKDLVNWTNAGEIQVAGRNNSKGAAKWANNSWAPAVAWKNIDGKDKFFIYFADNGSGIGVLTGDSPTGPFKDPLGKQLISRQTPNCANVNWLFDPAVFVDDDGAGYLYFGGGHDANNADHPKTARCVALQDDMISIKGVPQQIDAPFLFEDSGIHKYKDVYYYTYCTNWADRKPYNSNIPVAAIAYMTSKNPLGPFEYKGYTLENPGTKLGVWGNNHHWIFSFKDKWYIAYHAQSQEKMLGTEKGGYRNVFINDFNFNDDLSLPIQKISKEGVKQVRNFDPSEEIPAATFAFSRNIAVSNALTLVSVKDNSYFCVKSVEFPNKSCKIKIKYSPVKEKKNVTLQTGSFGSNGTEIAKIELNDKGISEATIALPENSLVYDLYFILPQDCEIISWQIM